MTNVPPIPKGFRIESPPQIPAGFRIESAPQESAAEPASNRGFTAFLNQGIASALGAPVDLVNAGLGAIGVPVSSEPFGGSASIARGMGAVGVRSAPAGAAPDSLPEYIGRGLGGAAGSLPAGAGIIGAASNATSPVIRGAAQTLSRPFVETPVRALGAEALAGAGSGFGESVANSMAPDSEGAKLAGSLAGGLTAGMLPAAINRFGPTRLAADFAASQLAPFTDRGALERARNRVGGLVGDKDAARRALEALGLSDLSPAARTGEPGLMALEQAVRREYPKVNKAMIAREKAAATQLTGAADDMAVAATAAEARDALSGRVSNLVSRMDERANKAMARADARISRLPPEVGQEQASIIVRDELEAAYREARREERKIWGLVPQDVKIAPENGKAAYDRVYAETAKAQRDNISPKAKFFLGKNEGELSEADALMQQVFGESLVPPTGFGKAETAKEIHGLYSALREEARIARGNSEFNRARISTIIADGLMADLEASAAVGGPMRDALDFSRQLNQRFTQGEVGRVLGSERLGGERIAPELTLDRTVGRGGRAGAVSVDAIRNATGTQSPPINDYVLGQFADSAIRDERLSVPRAESFLIRNRALLERVPEVREQIKGALGEVEGAQRTSARMQNMANDVSRGPAATFAQARQGAEVDAILRSPDPARYARQAMMQAKDKGDGVRRAFIDDLFLRARDVDASGELVTSGRKMIARLNDPTYRSALSGVMTRPEVSRLDRIANEFSRLEALRGDVGARGTVGATGAIMGDMPSTLIATPVTVIAARLGAKAGAGTSGASLKTSSFFSKTANDFLKYLTNDKAEALIVKAINDKETFDLLMWPIEKMSKERYSRLIETLTGITGAEISRQREGE